MREISVVWKYCFKLTRIQNNSLTWRSYNVAVVFDSMQMSIPSSFLHRLNIVWSNYSPEKYCKLLLGGEFSVGLMRGGRWFSSVFHSISLQCFRDAIRAAVAYKNNSTDFMDEIMKELEVSHPTDGAVNFDRFWRVLDISNVLCSQMHVVNVCAWILAQKYIILEPLAVVWVVYNKTCLKCTTWSWEKEWCFLRHEMELPWLSSAPHSNPSLTINGFMLFQQGVTERGGLVMEPSANHSEKERAVWSDSYSRYYQTACCKKLEFTALFPNHWFSASNWDIFDEQVGAEDWYV